jgi:hypothetical protein
MNWKRGLLTTLVLGCACAKARKDSLQTIEFVLPPGGISVGADSARLVLIEFGSHVCAGCKVFADSVLPAVLSRYARTGGLQYRFVEAGPTVADKASAFVECVAADSGFTAAVHRFYELVKEPRGVAEVEDFAGCRSSRVNAVRRAAERRMAKRIGVPGTPTFVLGRLTKPEGRVVGWVIVGAVEADSMTALIDQAAARIGR